MSEQYPKDAFDELVSSLESDGAYAAEMHEINAGFIEIEQAAVAAEHPGLFDPSRPNYSTAIDDVGRAIYDEYHELCGIYGADVHNPERTPEAFSQVQDEIAIFVYNLKRDLWSGDTVAATHALVVDMRREGDDSLGVVSLSEGETLVGKFARPIIGPMPDEMSVFTLGESGDPPIGIGLMLERPLIVEETGEAHADVFEGTEIIVALGTLGLSLHKITYRDDLER